MNFFKDRGWLRILLIAAFFLVGLVLTFYGWSLTGQLKGLIIMVVGIIFLLTALLVYNHPYRGKSR